MSLHPSLYPAGTLNSGHAPLSGCLSAGCLSTPRPWASSTLMPSVLSVRDQEVALAGEVRKWTVINLLITDQSKLLIAIRAGQLLCSWHCNQHEQCNTAKYAHCVLVAPHMSSPQHAINRLGLSIMAHCVQVLCYVGDAGHHCHLAAQHGLGDHTRQRGSEAVQLFHTELTVQLVCEAKISRGVVYEPWHDWWTTPRCSVWALSLLSAQAPVELSLHGVSKGLAVG